jgi:diguanylate cyclase (GGDEF)-like protein/PAS domain S-box-containing protein
MLKMMSDSELPCTSGLSDLSPERLNLIVSAFNHVSEGVMVISANGVVLEVNHSFSRITGFKASEVLGKKTSVLTSLFLSDDLEKNICNQLTDASCWVGEIWSKRSNGEVYPLQLSVNKVPSIEGKGHHFVSTFSDISAIKASEAELKKMAYYDVLTGLPNRLSLLDSINQAIVNVQTNQSLMAVAFIDLDGFKEINDRFGHVAGDLLLIDIANRVKDFLRKSDTFARLGGDEFVLVLSELDSRESAETLIESLLSLIEKELFYESTNIGVSASIGLVFYEAEALMDVNTLLHKADVAMYRAKENGKNAYYVLG